MSMAVCALALGRRWRSLWGLCRVLLSDVYGSVRFAAWVLVPQAAAAAAAAAAAQKNLYIAIWGLRRRNVVLSLLSSG